MEQEMTFGAWLKKRRRALDLTQQALADCAGCSLITIRKFEADERRPSRQLAELLADCLAITAEEREQFIAFARQPELASQLVAPPGTLPIPSLPAPPALSPLPPTTGAVSQPIVCLPAPLTNLLGREADVEAVSDLLLRPSVRLVTLTGPGGIGKTRLAIQVARQLADNQADRFPDGYYFVDLSSIVDPELFVPTLVEALGIVETAGSAPIVAIQAHLRHKRLLLVLDNFEQITGAAEALATILNSAAGVGAVITSRIVLHIYGEHEYPVYPLTTPQSPETMSLQALLDYPAIALFVERSRAVRPGFALTQENAAAVAGICARLDGLPLAIELAAAHSKMLNPPAILLQLANSLDLAARQRRASERQQTMRGAIDWSYKILSPEERHLFRAVGVFAGSFGLAEVEGILGEHSATDRLVLLDRLVDLVEKSMLRTVEFLDGPRFLMLFVLREYALEQLDAHGQTDRYRAAHLNFYLALARDMGQRVVLPDNEIPKSALLVANDDLRAAMCWAFEHPDHVVTGLEVAISLADFWKLRSMMNEGRRWLREGLEKLPAENQEIRARALVVSARLANYEAQYAESLRFGREALALFERLGEAADEKWLLMAYHIIGNSSADLGDFDAALHFHHRLLEIHRRRNNTVGILQMLRAIGLTSFDMGQFDEAAVLLAEAIDLTRQHGGWADDLFLNLNALGVVELVRGRFSVARPLFDEALNVAQRIETPMWQAMILNNLGHLEIPLGNLAEAHRYFAQAWKLALEINGRNHIFQSALGQATLALLENEPSAVTTPLMNECLSYHWDMGPNEKRFLRLSDVLALFCVRYGQPYLALQLLGRAETLRHQKFAQPRFANVIPVYELAMSLIEAQLDPASRAAAFREGAATAEEALLQQIDVAGKPQASKTYQKDHNFL